MKNNKLILSLLIILSLVLLAGCKKENPQVNNNQENNNQENSNQENSNQESNNQESNNQENDNQENNELKKIKVGASTSPHAEILEQVKEDLKAAGYDLEIIEYVDYVQPNLALDKGDLDANFFQHKPYLDQFNIDHKTQISSAAIIHYEPFGIYPGKTKTIDALAEGAQIAVPNDTTNEARALLLLEAEGLIKVKKDAGLKATIKDIIDNPKKLNIVEIEAAQLPRSLPDVDLAVINGNYAIEAGLKVDKDAIAIEGQDSEAANTYGNILAIKTGDENRDDIKALINALQTEKIKTFINEQYEGAVIPKF